MSTTPAWSDPDRPPESRVEALLAALTPEQKAGQLSVSTAVDPVRLELDTEAIERGEVGALIYSAGADPGSVTLPPAAELTERAQQAARRSPHGVGVLVLSDVIHGLATTFPVPLGLATGWDPDLVRRCAVAAAAEAADAGLHLSLAPMVDIAQEHRWGRVGETFGTEPELSARCTSATVAGFQADGRFAATAKHFVGYGLVRAEQDSETLSVGEQALRTVHLPPFRAAVEAGCRAIMVGLHDVDGVPMHAHRALVRDLLKGAWGFPGVVVSDWDGIGQLVQLGVAADRRAAARLALEAGVDLDLASGVYREQLPVLLADGDVDPALVDDAVRRVLRLKLDLGLLDAATGSRRPSRARPATHTASHTASHTSTHTALAREAAISSAVLIKNSGALLPLHPNVGLVHLCGPFADDAEALLGSWVFPSRPDRPPSIAEVLADRLGENLMVTDGRFADLALRRSEEADLTVAVVGTHPRCSGEDRCLPDTTLPVGQLELLRALAALGKPLVVLVVTANPPLLRPVLDLADAVLLVWHPGAGGAEGLADLLLGDASPTGRLPVFLPRTEPDRLVGTMDRGLGRRGRSRDAGLGRYLLGLGAPELALGFGLDYTSYGYSGVELSRDWLPRRAGVVRASVDVTNTGGRAGSDVVQLYARTLVAGTVRPTIRLVDWQRVTLAPGETRRVSFKITARTFDAGQRTDPRLRPTEVELTVGPDAARGTPARLRITD
ncbi:beta-glucosidase [Friedmanniella endophytica]|uniref:beta-glucosidase n=1 Tax=Microlunatus kandeliicorticis TaxID=1759536 RepID=A0A7W3IR17_9ACTN|nr:glycoside hydrolase family 3 N-terminal domain-containing protein [Microlunatus kandeliicorticis]MBA8793691.1 beta-glucosidase [Microlunatus kandeliicorticis]